MLCMHVHVVMLGMHVVKLCPHVVHACSHNVMLYPHIVHGYCYVVPSNTYVVHNVNFDTNHTPYVNDFYLGDKFLFLDVGPAGSGIRNRGSKALEIIYKSGTCTCNSLGNHMDLSMIR